MTSDSSHDLLTASRDAYGNIVNQMHPYGDQADNKLSTFTQPFSTR
jgi:hypothetical protein